MEITAKKVNQILVKYGYKLVMDQIHNNDEIKLYEKYEKNFNTRKYLTIKNTENFVIGRVYQINSLQDLSIDDIKLDERTLDIVIAFFKYFDIVNSNKVVSEIKKLSGINISKIKVDIIRNNVFKQEAS